ncbi:hypothetical protein CkaCkLH20_05026 [Colletotrichum karsti]|uniref:Uncharacterized protein n=1 Tax=Colletotrichum karsti TaxID=1095194 RepID=A0A9P6IB63_9PEZI|nr:uncharacterized protein CkaCkLH20_05026 [Colletotrichum karsti]KAF9877326.1 hypothetical protein CkaCkLH20_05026 [Colletotrichum karsti]
MPGLIPFLPTPPLPQSNRSAPSTFRARPVNNLSADRGAARGSSSQAPIELDSDSEPTEASGTQTATNTTSTTRLSQTQGQPQNSEPFFRDWTSLAVDSTQQRLPALPSFSDFTADLDFDYLNAVFGANPPHTPAREPDSDDFLSQLIDGDFSSPSSYPQSAQPPSVNRQTSSSRSQNSLSSLRPNRPAPTLPNNATPTTAAPRRGTPHPSFEVEESLFVSSDNEPEDYIMPVQTRRRASTTIISSSDQEADDTPPTSANRKRAAPSSGAARGTPAANKRRRTSQASTTRTRTTPGALPTPAPKVEDDDDVFGDKQDSKGKEKEAKDDDIIDLAASNEVPPEMLIPKEDKRVKLSAFQCVICMDDVTALTVTHCGMWWIAAVIGVI